MPQEEIRNKVMYLLLPLDKDKQRNVAADVSFSHLTAKRDNKKWQELASGEISLSRLSFRNLTLIARLGTSRKIEGERKSPPVIDKARSSALFPRTK